MTRHVVIVGGGFGGTTLARRLERRLPEEHALPLKLVGDAMFIRNRVLQRLARIELASDPARRRLLGGFVVIGGGFSGVEVAGALADLLPELPASLGEAAARSLAALAVFLASDAAASMTATAIPMDGGWTQH